MRRIFTLPIAVSIAVVILVLLFGGVVAFFTVAFLSLLEVALSFDNAVVNAQVLKKMTPRWRKRFLTWGMLIAVIGVRLVLPIVLVSIAGWISPILVAKLAFTDGGAYALLVEHARFVIDAFGGAFLAMVSLRYFFDSGKTVHWIRGVERRLAHLGAIESMELFVTLVFLAVAVFFTSPEMRVAITIAGILGIVLSVILERVLERFSSGTNGIMAQGLGLFLYLNVLDSAFSLDGVVGAFALTTAIPLIVIGLGIGAYFVRSLTLYLVEHRVLDSLVFIEHGAYWAIFGLALSMFVGLVINVPEFVTGSVGALFMVAAYTSSVRTPSSLRGTVK